MKLSARYPTIEAMIANTVQDGDCLIWQGYVGKNGYGQIGESKTAAHRQAWALACGEPTPGLVLHHICGRRACVNFEHLTEITPALHATIHHNVGERCEWGHKDWRPRRDGRRYCGECRNEYERMRYERRRAA